jgi:hypothetical protein
VPRKRKTTVVQFPSPGSPYSIVKHKPRRFWRVMKGEELIVVTVYRKGAREVVRRLEELDDLRRKFSGLRLISDLVTDTRSAAHA